LPSNGATDVNVILTNDGCAPDRSSVPAGSVAFSVVNQGGDAVDEVELKSNDRILGEREDLAPGLSGMFTVQLDAGSYVLACPGATTPQTTFVVLGPGAT
jgi:iron uptake system component EfeO